jgi:hypothetical protein
MRYPLYSVRVSRMGSPLAIDGVYVHGPWGRVEVPLSDRERVCSQWRESVREYYKSHDCEVRFDDKGCTIEEVDCDH